MISCVTCQANSALGGGDAVGWSIFFLLIVILLVAASVVFFMVRLAMRAKKYALEEEAAMLAESSLTH
jgi:large-conductance mechanosensitive channel